MSDATDLIPPWWPEPVRLSVRRLIDVGWAQYDTSGGEVWMQREDVTGLHTCVVHLDGHVETIE